MKTLTAIAFAFCLAAAPVWARGGGGCFEEGTPVLTPNGPVPIETLRVGDAVIGGRVEAIIRVQPEEYLEIDNGVHVTAEHPFQIAPGIFRMADRVFPKARRVSASHPAYNLLVSPSGTYIAGGFIVHNKGCFLPDTPILRADGTEAPIHEIRIGDKLLAFTPDGQVVRTTVRNILTHEVDEYLEVTTERTLLRVTVEHPFYVGEGTFKTLEALNVGDSVYAYDGHGLSAQKIISIVRVRSHTRVYNLQTDAPNTFFANSVAVHNKGGGGGGFGGGGFGGYHGGSGGGSGGDPTIFLIVVGVFVVIVIIQHASQGREDEDLDYVYSPSAVAQKAAKTSKLLEFIAKVDSNFKEDALQQRATEVFVKLQECWQAREYGPMQPLLMPDLYTAHCAQLQGLCRHHEINLIEGLQVQRVDIVNVRYTHEENQREFTVLITARARDYYVDDRDNHVLRGDDEPAQFQEFWTFQRQDGAWLLREIEQTRESDKLKEENVFEQFTDKGVAQVYGKTAGQEGPAGPWLEKPVETKATRIERLLNFLVQTDKLWDRQTMLERARQVFTDVMLAREAGDPTSVKDDELFPAVAVDLRQQIAKQRTAGLGIEYRNLCVRKAELILVRNFADNSRDEYTVRISAHAQKIIKRGGISVSQDEYVTPFMEYWTFGRLDGQWKLKEVVPPARGEEAVREENLDEDSGVAQLQWYYQQTRAT
ncbi:MAG TPA: TIM44-like domain-containing protein [Verrucomicrobiae bacterium]|nr:TIM44-like domain-containing protein [Verrucomicrobiae bacterium]